MERRITIKKEGYYEEDYQMAMLRLPEIQSFLRMRGRGVDEESYYDFDVSGKQSMGAIFEKHGMETEDLKCFLLSLLEVWREAERFLLYKHCILLQPEYMFYDGRRYRFAYLPKKKGNVWKEFHDLTEYFVKKVSYEDEGAVKSVFHLHKKSMEENYSLKNLCGETLEMLKEEKKQEESYPEEIHREIGEEEGSNLIKEEERGWFQSVKKVWKKHQKNKWGDWEEFFE